MHSVAQKGSTARRSPERAPRSSPSAPSTSPRRARRSRSRSAATPRPARAPTARRRCRSRRGTAGGSPPGPTRCAARRARRTRRRARGRPPGRAAPASRRQRPLVGLVGLAGGCRSRPPARSARPTARWRATSRSGQRRAAGPVVQEERRGDRLARGALAAHRPGELRQRLVPPPLGNWHARLVRRARREPPGLVERLARRQRRQHDPFQAASRRWASPRPIRSPRGDRVRVKAGCRELARSNPRPGPSAGRARGAEGRTGRAASRAPRPSACPGPSRTPFPRRARSAAPRRSRRRRAGRAPPGRRPPPRSRRDRRGARSRGAGHHRPSGRSASPAARRARPRAERAIRRRRAAGSTSRTTSPDARPVAIATFASGKRRHHSKMVFGSVVARRGQSRSSGCLPGLAQSLRPQRQRPSVRTPWTGKTRQPRRA